MSTPILPGATIGILGNGQLGRMLAQVAQRMGYRVHTYGPDPDSPAGQVAHADTVAAYDDLDAVRHWAQGVDVVTFEFENVLSTTTAAAAEYAPVRPGGSVLHTTQQRLREKTFLATAGFPHTPFHPVHSLADLHAGLARLGYPAVLKTAGFGYDGKGQQKINSGDHIDDAFAALRGQAGVLEAWIPFERELSVVAARSLDGSFAHYGVIENTHHHHILDISVAPAAIPQQVTAQAVSIARAVLEELQVVGVLCVEFFLTTDEQLLINELAPRPHNSGHLTIDACVTSQFEQQLRAICGLPLGATDYLRPAAMCNLLGDLWSNGEPNWAAALALPDVKLHLYGKREARLGRKMGHLTATAGTAGEAVERVRQAREVLQV